MGPPDQLSATENDERIRRVLEKHPRIVLAVLFGSVARNAAGVDSDLDLAVSADRPLDADEKMQLIMDLAEASGRPVDLVDLLTVGEPLTCSIRRILCPTEVEFFGKGDKHGLAVNRAKTGILAALCTPG